MNAKYMGGSLFLVTTGSTPWEHGGHYLRFGGISIPRASIDKLPPLELDLWPNIRTFEGHLSTLIIFLMNIKTLIPHSNPVILVLLP